MRARAAAVAIVGVVAFALPGAALGGWQTPVPVVQDPIPTASFLEECYPGPCPPEDWTFGRFRLTGPRTGAGIIQLPHVVVFDDETGEVVPDGVVTPDSNLRFGVRTTLYAIAVKDGVWEQPVALGSPLSGLWSPEEGVPSVDVDADAAGHVMIAYSIGPAMDSSTWARRWDAASGWSAPDRLDRPATRSYENSGVVNLSVAPDGQALVAFEDDVCVPGGSYSQGGFCQSRPIWARHFDGSTWQPAYQVVEWAPPFDVAYDQDGTGLVTFATPVAEAANVAYASVFGTNGRFGAPIGNGGNQNSDHQRLVGGPGGSGLLVFRNLSESPADPYGLMAQRFDGSAWGPRQLLSTAVPTFTDRVGRLDGSATDATLVLPEGGWTGNADVPYAPGERRLTMRRFDGTTWSPAQAIDGGLADPAPPSVNGPDDLALGHGLVAFTAGKLSGDRSLDQQRVYAVDLSGPAPGEPTPIDNGGGGAVHVVAADRDPVSGSALVLFTQFGPDGNSRLYAAENLPAEPQIPRPPRFGKVLCGDATSVRAGCMLETTDPVLATVAVPKITPAARLALTGTVATQVARPPGTTLPTAPRATASATVTKRVQVAIQRRAGRTCTWWSAARARFVERACHKPLWVTVTPRGSSWRYKTPKRIPQGKVTVWARGLAGTGAAARFRPITRQQVFKLGRSKRTAVRRP